MVEPGGVTTFPVVFFDGEKEMNIGTVQINPVLEYKPFQLILSQKIGISPNQISIYLVDRNKDAAPPLSNDIRKIPITGKVNFGVVCGLKDCYFLVVLKRSRKPRNRREKTPVGVEICSFFPGNEFSSPPVHPVPENLILLRRNRPVPYYDNITQSRLADFNVRLQSLRFRENHQLATAEGYANPRRFDSSPSPIGDPNLDYFSGTGDFYGMPSSTTTAEIETETPLCTECVHEEKKNEDTTSFHACVRDAVITRFATRWGPINRPNKPRG